MCWRGVVLKTKNIHTGKNTLKKHYKRLKIGNFCYGQLLKTKKILAQNIYLSVAILVRKKIVGITQNFKMYGIMLKVTQQRIYWIELKYYGGKKFLGKKLQWTKNRQCETFKNRRQYKQVRIMMKEKYLKHTRDNTEILVLHLVEEMQRIRNET